ncbi:MAG: hypothetical protein ABEL51_01950 [Salinibacter sp.]
MNDQPSSHTGASRRLTAESPPSLLLVGRDAELRFFLRTSLQRWYQIAEAADADEMRPHLAHCPPRGLIAGRMGREDKEALITALHDADAPPVLKLWTTSPPSGWAEAALRYPFTRAALLRAVDQLIDGAEEDGEADDDPPGVNEVQLQTNVRS